jgi:molybdate transport system substrate-binding protein
MAAATPQSSCEKLMTEKCRAEKCLSLKRKFFTAILLGLCATCSSTSAQQGESLTIAAAADLVYCLEDLNLEFRKSHPEVALKVSAGASGNLFAQIRNGAPFDIFMSADMKYPEELVKTALADSSSLTLYAIGHLVLWSMNPAIPVELGLESLRDEKVKRIAIANPEHAPYGRAAKAALVHGKLWDAIQSKLVLGENIAQTAQFVQTGNVDAGIVALSLVLASRLNNAGKYYEIPESYHPRLDQGAVLTKTGRAKPAAKVYVNFIRSDQARAVFNRYGFRLPQ